MVYGKFYIRKGPDKWAVFMGDVKVIELDSWEECAEMVCYSIRSHRTKTIPRHRGRLAHVLDLLFLFLGVISTVALVAYNMLPWTPIPMIFVLVSLRGLLLQDYYHISNKSVFRKVRKHTLR